VTARLPWPGWRAEPRSPLAAVGDEAALDVRVGDLAVRHAEVGAIDRVGAEQRAERALGRLGLGEDEQPRGLLVDAVHDVQRGGGGAAAGATPALAQ
jgi:hypothetical protein